MRYWWHWAILVLVVLLVFGANRLPDVARSVGQSLKIFKKEVKDLTGDDAGTTKDEATNGDGAAPKA